MGSGDKKSDENVR